MTTATVKSIEKVGDINIDSSVFRVSFDNGSEALMICAPDEPYKYLDQLVDYETRKDLYEGNIHDFIATIADKRVVNTINRTEHIKLFADSVDNSSNIAFADIGFGETYNGCIFYCNKVNYNSSARADWLELVVSDRVRRVSKIRLFSPNITSVEEFAGHYIRCDVRKTKFGFTTQDIFLCDVDYAPNPELDIAETYLKDVFKDDEALTAAMSSINIIPFMKECVTYERGALLLECAMEVDLALELGNVVPGVDTKALAKAFVADKFWCTSPNSHYAKEFLSVHKCLSFRDVFDAKVQDIIGGNVPNIPDERILYDKIKELVRSIVVVRKGDVYDN